MVELDDEKIRKIVRESYGKIADRNKGYSCCSPSSSSTQTSSSSCCGDVSLTQNYSSRIGYSEEELRSVPEGANLGLGCGNPTALASIKEGEVVVDLGSGAGFDCFLAANKVGKSGKVIGIDMTAQMIDSARENAKKGDYENIEFRLGEIENLPVADNTADLIISNCVINLSPDKERVFHEAFRVLKSGGRMMISDIVLTEELPYLLKQNLEAYVSCVSGALLKEKYISIIQDVGFQNIEIVGESYFPIQYMITDHNVNEFKDKFNLTPEQVEEIRNFNGAVISLKVKAFKPNNN
ncbi:MAG: arsenite methyltransferase [Promethearchaeota archaeon]